MMREIKFLGTFKKEGISRSYAYSIFECPMCLNHVEKVRKDGIKAKTCGRKCYGKLRTGNRYGPYKDKVEISGYLYKYMPVHPDSTKSGYVAEHRLVAEEKLGRRIKSNEDVHHINEDKHDNRPDNLEVLTDSEHSRLHAVKRWRNPDGKFTI